MIKKILFTHVDLDGAGCKILFTLANDPSKLGNDYLVINCENTNVDLLVEKTINENNVDANTLIYFADICASREILEMLKDSGFIVRIYDHHRTNFFATHIFDNAVIVPENELGVPECGTSLLFKAFCNNEITSEPMNHYMIETYFNSSLIEEFVEKVRLWDTYQWKDTNDIDARKLQILFTLLGMERFCDIYINKLINAKQNTLLIDRHDMMFIDARLESEQRAINSITKEKVYDVNIRGFNAAFALSKDGADVSELGNQFLTKYPEYDMFISFSLFGDGAYSFRSIRDDIDIGKDFALLVGGGGHPKAAGAPITSEVKEILANTLLENLDPGYEIIKSPYQDYTTDILDTEVKY